ncbi:MAG: hypothetical protein Q9204_007857 [Flavoplaca sp. TL-2023a]
MMNLTRTADYLAANLKQLGFLIMSKGGGQGLPLVAFRLDREKGHYYDEFAIAHQLRERGWVVPAYTMAPHSENLKMMRVVVREDFSRARCDTLVQDIKLALQILKAMDQKTVETRKKEHYGYQKQEQPPALFEGKVEFPHAWQGSMTDRWTQALAPRKARKGTFNEKSRVLPIC